jgi:hypothetical protein
MIPSSNGSLLRCEPRWATPRTVGRKTLGGRAAVVARALGYEPMPWQQMVWDVGLELLDNGRPAYREIWIEIPRQSGKTTLVLVVEVDRAINWVDKTRPAKDFGPQRIAYSAQTRDDGAKKLVNDQIPVLEASALYGYVSKPGKGIGNEHVLFKNGSRIMVLSTQKKSGHGKTLDLAVLDEFFADEDDRREQSVRPAQITRPYAQTWGLSTAGTAESIPLLHKVEVGRAAVEAGKTRGVAYFEWSADPDADPGDEDVWASMMPALGHTIEIEMIRHEYETLALGEFKRAYLNQWTTTSERVIPSVQWELVCSDKTKPSGQVAFGVDMTPERTSAAIVVCDEFARLGISGRDGLMDHREGVGWVSARVVELAHKHNAIVGVDTASPAHALADDWERQGVEVQRLNAREMAGATGSFFDAVMNRTVSIKTDPSMDAAAAGARKRVSGDVWYWARKNTSTDVSPLVAASIARWVAVAPDGPSVYSERGMTVLG